MESADRRRCGRMRESGAHRLHIEGHGGGGTRRGEERRGDTSRCGAGRRCRVRQRAGAAVLAGVVGGARWQRASYVIHRERDALQPTRGARKSGRGRWQANNGRAGNCETLWPCETNIENREKRKKSVRDCVRSIWSTVYNSSGGSAFPTQRGMHTREWRERAAETAR